MSETSAKTKLVQYLTEAYGKEKELETSLAAHIQIASRAAYRKRLESHLEETRAHAVLVQERLAELGGGGVSIKLAELASRGVATAKGPLHALRGTGPEEKELKNAKTEYSEEHEEIATYLAIETLAIELGDEETANVAKRIRAEEERMAAFLEQQIPVLTRAVAKAEIPAEERPGPKPAKPARRSSSAGSKNGRRAKKPKARSAAKS